MNQLFRRHRKKESGGKDIKLTRRKSQALSEIAIFVSIMLVIVSFLVYYGQSANYQQSVQMRTFLRAMFGAFIKGTVATETDPRHVVTVIEDKSFADITNPFGLSNKGAAVASADITWTNNMFLDSDYEDYFEPRQLPKVNMQFGFKFYRFTVAGYKMCKVTSWTNGLLGYDIICGDDFDNPGRWIDPDCKFNFSEQGSMTLIEMILGCSGWDFQEDGLPVDHCGFLNLFEAFAIWLTNMGDITARDALHDAFGPCIKKRKDLTLNDLGWLADVGLTNTQVASVWIPIFPVQVEAGNSDNDWWQYEGIYEGGYYDVDGDDKAEMVFAIDTWNSTFGKEIVEGTISALLTFFPKIQEAWDAWCEYVESAFLVKRLFLIDFQDGELYMDKPDPEKGERYAGGMVSDKYNRSKQTITFEKRETPSGIETHVRAEKQDDEYKWILLTNRQQTARFNFINFVKTELFNLSGIVELFSYVLSADRDDIKDAFNKGLELYLTEILMPNVLYLSIDEQVFINNLFVILKYAIEKPHTDTEYQNLRQIIMSNWNSADSWTPGQFIDAVTDGIETYFGQDDLTDKLDLIIDEENPDFCDNGRGCRWLRVYTGKYQWRGKGWFTPFNAVSDFISNLREGSTTSSSSSSTSQGSGGGFSYY